MSEFEKLIEKQKSQSKRNKNLIFSMIKYTFLITLSVIMAAPFVYMIITSFKDPSEVIGVPPSFWIDNPTLKNYMDIFRDNPYFALYILNSLIVAVTVTITNILFGSMAGFAFAKLRFYGKNWLFLVVIGSMMIPWQVNLVPSYIIVKELGLTTTLMCLIIPTMANAFGLFLMRQFIMGVPNDLMSAARVDGCSDWRIYWNIILPLSRPVISALAIFTFLANWNSFIWPLIVLDPKSMKILSTLTLALSTLNSESGDKPGLLMAAGVIMVVPVIIVFLLFQKQFIAGITFTGLKE